MRIDTKVEGIDDVMRAIRKMDDRAKKKHIPRILRQQAKPFVKAARAKVPESTEEHYRYSGGVVTAVYQPGNLRKSIGIKKLKGLAVSVGPRKGKKFKNDGYYGYFVEYGTRNMGAQPFMRPAYSSQKANVNNNIQNAIEKVMTKI